MSKITNSGRDLTKIPGEVETYLRGLLKRERDNYADQAVRLEKENRFPDIYALEWSRELVRQVDQLFSGSRQL